MQDEGFIFEDLKVYQRMLDWAVELTSIASKLPPVYSRIRDQLIGAGISAPLNLAEGSGRVTAKDKKNFYKNSRGSIFEVVAILTIVRKMELIKEDDFSRLRHEAADLARIVSALMSRE